MSDESLRDLLLCLARARPLVAPTAEAGHAAVEAAAGRALDPAAFHAAVAALVRDGLLEDPVLLEDQSLQCRWRLRPTPAGAR